MQFIYLPSFIKQEQFLQTKSSKMCTFWSMFNNSGLFGTTILLLKLAPKIKGIMIIYHLRIKQLPSSIFDFTSIAILNSLQIFLTMLRPIPNPPANAEFLS